MWVHMCLQVHIHVCAHACWGKELALGDFLHLSISLILVDEGRVSLWTLSFPVPLNSVASLLWKPLSLVFWTLGLQVGLEACGPCISERPRPPRFMAARQPLYPLCHNCLPSPILLFLWRFIFIHVSGCVCVCLPCLWECMGGQKRPSDP